MAVKCPKCRSDNPDTLKFCGECGTRISGESAADGIRGHEPNSPEFGIVSPNSMDPRLGATETMRLPLHELTTGSTFAGRYQIIEELGHGGMGQRLQGLRHRHQGEDRPQAPAARDRRRQGDGRALLERAQAGPQDQPPERLPDVRPGQGRGDDLHHHGVRAGGGPEEVHPEVRPARGRAGPSRSPSRFARAWPRLIVWGSSIATSSPRTS